MLLPRITRSAAAVVALALAWPALATAPWRDAAASTASTSTPGLATAEVPAAPVRGFIVQMRDAVPHAPAGAGRASALLASTTSHAEAAATVAARQRVQRQWRRLLATSATPPGLSALRLRAVGLSQHELRAERALTSSEVKAWQAWLSEQPEVAWVVPDQREMRLQDQVLLPDDPLFAGVSQQWWLQPVSGGNADVLAARLRGVPGFQTAWSTSTGSAATVVAVLDSGVTSHPDLDPQRLLPGFDMVSDWDSALGRGYANDGDGRDADPSDPGDWVSAADQTQDAGRYASCGLQDSSWHGSIVTGLLAARTGNALGVAGMDAAARILPVRVAGKCGASVADIVDGMRWAAGLAVCQRWSSTDASGSCAEWAPLNPTPARVVNISFGGALACNAAYQTAIDELWSLGVVVVAAAGNQHAAPTRPANCEKVIGVAALNRDGFKANYSNFGASLRIATAGGDDTGGLWGGLLADGGLFTLGNTGVQGPGLGSYERHSGTSFAAPLVSGTVALMLAVNPGLTPAQISAGLTASARPHVQSSWMAACSSANPGRCLCTTSTCGAGILDAPQALQWAQAAAQGRGYAPPDWVAGWIDTPELRAAVALGQDREAAAGTGGTDGTTTSGGSNNSGNSGGGGMDALAALLLLALAWALGALPRGVQKP